MLKQLTIDNFTLIDHLRIDFHQGFSVITGETGAGKSIILGAVNLLMGQRADTKAIKAGKDRCVVEAHFSLGEYDLEAFFSENDLDYDEEDCILRRQITAQGKSRAFVNDSPVSLSVMRSLAEKLIDIHSQHKNLLLASDDFQLNVVDIVAKDNNEKEAFHKAFENYLTLSKRLNALKQRIQEAKEKEDFSRFQYEELLEANLQEGMQEKLEAKAGRMEHIEEIKTALFATGQSLSESETGNVLGLLREAVRTLSSVEKHLTEASSLRERMDTCYIELKDIAQETLSIMETTDFNPEEMAAVHQRLDTLYSLMQKHRKDSVGELIEMRDSLKEQLNEIDNSAELLEQLDKETSQAKTIAEHCAVKLSKKRKQGALAVDRYLVDNLRMLGMENVRFCTRIEPCKMSKSGTDSVAFLFSANKNVPLRQVGEIASGGEIARVMLSLKALISSVTCLPTIVFDEIDTGVSGKTAEKMAEIMRQMSLSGRQVISITHLPQIASRGGHHYLVKKEDQEDGTTSSMRELSQEERISEIAQMLSGENITAAAIENAKELLSLNAHK